jgi:CRISPR-associated endonuclease/helicase Cas3
MPGVKAQTVKNLLSASVGHHGRPPDEGDWTRLVEPALGAASLPIALQIFDEVTAVVPPPIDLVMNRQTALDLSWQASGLVTVADWVGSDADFFGPGRIADPKTYYEEARQIARRALAKKGLIPSAPTPKPGLAAAAPEITTPHPMQSWAHTVELPEGHCLAVIEDVTGSGKTEAALTLASRMIAAGKGEGLYFALPTEATANAMFDRLKVAHRGLFASEASPSLVLAHGRAALSEPFAKVRSAAPDSTEAQCNDWIADHRRKAFFADVGAGTIDQAFLAILQKRHLTLRQYGLAGRILIVDEAHAFDAYMEEELARLLSLHTLSGGSAIVLSATLPLAKRAAMIKAYVAYGEPQENAFPLATLAARSGVIETPVAPAPSGQRIVTVRRVSSVEDMHQQAAEAAQAGAAVLVMRNAVDEAIASKAAICELGCATDLFHARFAHVDRAVIERRVLDRFGKRGTGAGRAGQVLVATQVVEQSLDVDFDVIFTDLAPVDLLVQRAGRLWRHARDGRPVPAPVMHILSPEPTGDVAAEWLAPVLGAGAHVYRNPGVMWRSARVIFGVGRIETPGELRCLIEAVYGPGAEPVPKGLELRALEAEGTELGHRAQADFNTIELAAGYGVLGDLPQDQEIGTRLGEEVRILRLARLDEGEVRPWAEGRQGWARSELKVPAKWLCNLQEPTELVAALGKARSGWPEWDRAMMGVVEEEGKLRLEGETALRYDTQLGLRREVID